MLTEIEVVFAPGEIWALNGKRHKVDFWGGRTILFLDKVFSYICIYICQNLSDCILKMSYLDEGKNDRHIAPQNQECFLKKCPEVVKPYSLLRASPVHLFKSNLEKQ